MSWYPVVVISDLEILQQMLLKQPDVFSDRPKDLPYFKVLFKGQGKSLFPLYCCILCINQCLPVF